MLMEWLTGAHRYAHASSPVGVQTLRVPGSVPFDFYYPASSAVKPCQARWFRSTVADFLWGHLWFMFGSSLLISVAPIRVFELIYLFAGRSISKLSQMWHRLLQFLMYLLSFVLPVSYSYVPSLYRDAKPADLSGQRKHALLIFSHGLSGTGEEHALMFTHFVQQGFVVAAVSHCDGSSVRAQLSDGSIRMYEHPSVEKYGTRFRINQVSAREHEVDATREFVLEHSSFPAQLRSLIDPACVLIGGFSYGAATAALAVTRHPSAYRGAILLDGWFFINLANYPGWGDDQIMFPPEAHAKPAALRSIPTLWIGSHSFQSGEQGQPTRTLAASAGAPVPGTTGAQPLSEWHVLPDTYHQNFCDLGFWLPARLLRRLKMIGPCDFHTTYADLLGLQTNFMRKVHAQARAETALLGGPSRTTPSKKSPRPSTL
jgi:predicted esterase